MRLVAWNILHGGGTARTPEIVLTLCGLNPDVVVLSEFRRTMGGQIAGVLWDRGLTHQAWTDPPSGRNGLLIASRFPLEPGDEGPGAGFEHRFLDVRLPGQGLHLTGVHAPDAQRHEPESLQRQAQFWQHVVRLCDARRNDRHVVIGDLNAGRLGFDGAGPSLTGGWFLGRISTFGYRDAYRLCEPSGRAVTWLSHAGNGLRIDAAWVSEALRDWVSGVSHGASPMLDRHSDHAPVVVELGVA